LAGLPFWADILLGVHAPSISGVPSVFERSGNRFAGRKRANTKCERNPTRRVRPGFPAKTRISRPEKEP
jgi:hypothetical protein